MLSWPSTETHKDVGCIIILSENIIRNIEPDAKNPVLALFVLNLIKNCYSQEGPHNTWHQNVSLDQLSDTWTQRTDVF